MPSLESEVQIAIWKLRRQKNRIAIKIVTATKNRVFDELPLVLKVNFANNDASIWQEKHGTEFQLVQLLFEIILIVQRLGLGLLQHFTGLIIHL